MTNRDVGELIKQRRIACGMSAEDLGCVIEKSEGTVLRYERAELDMKLSTLLKIAEALGVTVSSLLSGAKPKAKKPIEIRIYQIEDRMNVAQILVKNGYTVSQVKVSREGQRTVEYRLRLEECDDNIRVIK